MKTLILCGWLALLVAARADWPMHRGDPQLSGRSDMPAPAEPKVAWTFNAGKPVKAAAAIAGKRVFFGDDEGIVHALDLTNGKELWTYKLPAPAHTNPVTYSVGGRQYVAIVSTGGSFLATPIESDQLTVFALPRR